jgi:chromosome segregation ATPase
MAAGIFAQPSSIRESSVREEFLGALAHVDKGRPKEAVQAFRQLLEKHPDVSEAWNNLATLEAAMGDLDAARLSLRKALDCQQASQVALRNLDRVVGRMARAAWDSALSSPSSVKDGPKLDLVRELVEPVDTSAIRRRTDSLKTSIQRLARDRDSLARLRKTQHTILDSIRNELKSREATLQALFRRRGDDSTRAEDLRASYARILKRSDSLDGVLRSRRDEAETLKGLLERRTREADSLRKVIARREAEGDSLRKTLARVERERLEARRRADKSASEVAKALGEADGARVASLAGEVPAIGEATKDPLATVREWATAWSRKDVEAYLSFYSEDFAPRDGRKEWEALRRRRIGIDDSITVQVLEPKVERLADGKVVVGFRQIYEAGATRLTTRKRIVLRREVPGWKILLEEGGSR